LTDIKYCAGKYPNAPLLSFSYKIQIKTIPNYLYSYLQEIFQWYGFFNRIFWVAGTDFGVLTIFLVGI